MSHPPFSSKSISIMIAKFTTNFGRKSLARNVSFATVQSTFPFKRGCAAPVARAVKHKTIVYDDDSMGLDSKDRNITLTTVQCYLSTSFQYSFKKNRQNMRTRDCLYTVSAPLYQTLVVYNLLRSHPDSHTLVLEKKKNISFRNP